MPLSAGRDTRLVIDKTKIVTHAEPAERERTNYILRLDLTADGMPGEYEQMWMRTDDRRLYELCCIPFFTYGLSLGDVISLIDDNGAYRVESKSGHRTMRIFVQDDAYAHEQHEDLHASLVGIGVRTEFYGHARRYAAIDLADQTQVDAVIETLAPLVDSKTLIWEWADPTPTT